MRNNFLIFTAFLTLVSINPVAASSGPKWQGTLPAFSKDQAAWGSLQEQLLSNHMAFGAMAAAARALIFFNDLEGKEKAYRTIIQLIEQGYPHSVQSLFLPGDLAPEGDYDFVNSYNLYKSILNKDRGMKKWADHYASLVDHEGFGKYKFFSALALYNSGKLKEAEEALKKILAKELPEDKLPFVRTVSRTLARVYFDQEEFEKSADIYLNFLLKLNPVIPSDYLEAAWSLYYQKKHSEALGMLYNLESSTAGTMANLEKYTIRALSYRNLCAIPNAETLIESFKHDFGPTLNAILTGEPLTNLAQLVMLEAPENREYKEAFIAVERLKDEQNGISLLDDKAQVAAKYLYETEIRMLTQKVKGLREQAIERSATKLMMMGEHLRFLKYDIQRERFNPDTVFKQTLDGNGPKLIELPDRRFVIQWTQFGDFWRDERHHYKGVLNNRCFE